jgi:hypothetical protein
MTSPNALTPDPLTLAYARMRAATVEQLREALAAHQRGEAIGCYALAIAPLVALGVGG